MPTREEVDELIASYTCKTEAELMKELLESDDEDEDEEG